MHHQFSRSDKIIPDTVNMNFYGLDEYICIYIYPTFLTHNFLSNYTERDQKRCRC